MKNKKKSDEMELTHLTIKISRKLKKQLKFYVNEHSTFIGTVVCNAISNYISNNKK